MKIKLSESLSSEIKKIAKSNNLSVEETIKNCFKNGLTVCKHIGPDSLVFIENPKTNRNNFILIPTNK